MDPSYEYAHRYNNHQYATHTRTQTSSFLFAVAQNLTRLASKQASESVIYLFRLAPRSRGRRLIGRRGFFGAEMCV